MIYGSLLGDGYAERKNHSTHLVLQQEDSNMEYLKWFHKKLVDLGYCKIDKPILEKRIGFKGKIRYFYRIRTFNYTSFNFIHDSFYLDGKKIIPNNISNYLTPLALAIWIKDDGTKNSSSLRLCTHSFTKKEVKFLGDVLFKKYNLLTSLHLHKVKEQESKEQYYLYISSKSLPHLFNIVKPYKHKSMKYKLS
jgi:ubiquinol-cytochrome c reductase cytochrome b subunit